MFNSNEIGLIIAGGFLLIIIILMYIIIVSAINHNDYIPRKYLKKEQRSEKMIDAFIEWLTTPHVSVEELVEMIKLLDISGIDSKKIVRDQLQKILDDNIFMYDEIQYESKGVKT